MFFHFALPKQQVTGEWPGLSHLSLVDGIRSFRNRSSAFPFVAPQSGKALWTSMLVWCQDSKHSSLTPFDAACMTCAICNAFENVRSGPAMRRRSLASSWILQTYLSCRIRFKVDLNLQYSAMDHNSETYDNTNLDARWSLVWNLGSAQFWMEPGCNVSLRKTMDAYHQSSTKNTEHFLGSPSMTLVLIRCSRHSMYVVQSSHSGSNSSILPMVEFILPTMLVP